MSYVSPLLLQYDIDHDPSSYTINITSNINNNNNRKEVEEETEIKNTNNRFVSSLTGNNSNICSNNKITSQIHVSQTKATQISTELAAIPTESICDGTVIPNTNPIKTTNNNKKLSAFNCDKTDKKPFERETDSIFVQTESWRTAKTYTDAIKQRRDSTLLGKYFGLSSHFSCLYNSLVKEMLIKYSRFRCRNN